MSTSVSIATTDTVMDTDQNVPHEAVQLEDVLDEERGQIEEIRKRRGASSHAEKYSRNPDAPLEPPIPERLLKDVDKPKWQTRNDGTYPKWREVIRAAHDKNYVGLALSGGGIRSATFNLGVLQALATLKLLFRVDYLSTVSGGGYIGGWLTAWTKRQADFHNVQERIARKLTSFGYTQAELEPNRVHQEDDKEPPPIRFLRVFSNYLTPKLGLLGGDTWTTVAIYLRNLLLNLVIVLALVTTLLLVPRVVQRLAYAMQGAGQISHVLIGVVLGVSLLIAFVMILANMADLDSLDRKAKWYTRQRFVLIGVAVPLLAAAVLAALWLAGLPETKAMSYGETAAIGACLYGAIWLLATALTYRKWIAGLGSRIVAGVGDLAKKNRRGSKRGNVTRNAVPWAALFGQTLRRIGGTLRQSATLLVSEVAAIASGAMAGGLYGCLLGWVPRGEVTKALTWGVPAVVGIFVLAGVLHIGLMGTTFQSWKREWWGRLGGWLLLLGTAWLVMFWVALCFPNAVWTGSVVKAAGKWIAGALTPVWVLSTVASVLFGKSRATGTPGAETWRDAVAKVGPFLFIAGLLCWVSYGISVVQSKSLLGAYTSGHRQIAWDTIYTGWLPIDSLLNWLSPKVALLLTNVSQHRLWWATIACLVFTCLMAWRVDINAFSMNLFYRNRLVRCYLGASNKMRSPSRFTGFDRTDDDVALKDLNIHRNSKYDGPYPILNASLNLVKGQDLAWQERKAESFAMTPLYCGYDVWLEEQDSPMLQRERRVQDRYGYRHTEEYAINPSQRDGLTLGTAMSISGAAASPNMGFYSSMPVAFLMTVFNVRLGQWLGNPRHHSTFERATPWFGLNCLLSELFAQTDDDARYVYLSDGGHFDNLGLYELVKRRCGLIIVCDVEEDGQYKFAGLANAIRKCRIDLGIGIDLDVSDLIPTKGSGFSEKHCAIGTIHYEQVDLDARTGRIIYFKASLTKDDPADLKTYRARNPLFPHESTIDQWFSESQFESYRELGYHTVFSSIKPDDRTPKAESLEKELCNVLDDFGFDSSVRPKFNEVYAREFEGVPDHDVKHIHRLRTALNRFKHFLDSLPIVGEPVDGAIQDVRLERYALRGRGNAELEAKLHPKLQKAEILLEEKGLACSDRDRIMRVLSAGWGIPPCLLESELQEVRAWLCRATTPATLAVASALYHGRFVALPGTRRILKEGLVSIVNGWINRGEISGREAPELHWLIRKLIEEKLIRPFEAKEYLNERDSGFEEFHEGVLLRSVGKAAYLFEVNDPDRPHEQYPIGRFPGSTPQEALV